MTRIARVVATGRVQGVGYRAWTAETARTLGLAGHVRNRRDGAVEALLAGPPELVARMLELMRTGPAFARVEHLAIEEGGEAPGADFVVFSTV